MRRVKEGTSAVLDEKWWADSMECYCYLRNIKDLWSDGKTLHERRFGMSFNGPVIPFGAMVEYHPISAKDPIETTSIWSKRLAKYIPRLCIGRMVNLERRHSSGRH